MTINPNTVRKQQHILHMPLGTAMNRLRKSIMFHLVQETGKDVCFKCGLTIETANEFSIEHKKPWQSSNDESLFWDLDNIAFSHISCNRPHKTHKIESPDGMGWCSHCQTHKILSEFNKGTRNGSNRWCRICTTTYENSDAAKLKRKVRNSK